MKFLNYVLLFSTCMLLLNCTTLKMLRGDIWYERKVIGKYEYVSYSFDGDKRHYYLVLKRSRTFSWYNVNPLDTFARKVKGSWEVSNGEVKLFPYSNAYNPACPKVLNQYVNDWTSPRKNLSVAATGYSNEYVRIKRIRLNTEK